ncbi:unnamed protein product [Heligmosomoides polygyrus]|uniref:Glutamine amidotransferase type-1 domain-containing protein n=1 Tax=Heligmosomoides polygyrus TaxID=6339 RepID=A0A183F7C0_HELPZ|nr:unnamed protein product [Heligmosomoides polygyrus]
MCEHFEGVPDGRVEFGGDGRVEFGGIAVIGEQGAGIQIHPNRSGERSQVNKAAYDGREKHFESSRVATRPLSLMTAEKSSQKAMDFPTMGLEPLTT